jgi:hypothetical protein
MHTFLTLWTLCPADIKAGFRVEVERARLAAQSRLERGRRS